jgi:glutathione S-transferase
MYAPVCTRFVTYDVDLPDDCAAYVQAVMALPEMVEWLAAAQEEPDALEELDVDVEF